jgi:hypothetical protein
MFLFLFSLVPPDLQRFIFKYMRLKFPVFIVSQIGYSLTSVSMIGWSVNAICGMRIPPWRWKHMFFQNDVNNIPSYTKSLYMNPENLL